MSIELTPDLLKSILAEAIIASKSENTRVSTDSTETSYHVKPPEEFDFKEPLMWKPWINRFNMFRVATGLNSKPASQQINMLLYCMGKEADDLLTSLGVGEKDWETYEKIIEKFNSYFMTKKNIFYQRTLFIQNNQKPDEKIDSYINDLYKMAEKCEWSCQQCKSRSYFEDMIMLKLVTGISDKNLSTHLQLQDNLSLEKVIQSVRQAEAVKQQQDEIRCGTEPFDLVEEMKRFPQNSFKSSKSTYRPNRISGNNFAKGCSFCGSNYKHSLASCPAREKECFKCGNKGHFSTVCRTTYSRQRNVKEVETERLKTSGVDNFNLNVLNIFGEEVKNKITSQCRPSAFYVKCKVNCGPDVQFKVDTGADVRCMGLNEAKKLGLKMKSTEIVLKGAGNVNLNVLGKCTVLLQKGNIFHKEDIFIVENQNEPLLGRGGIAAFELIKEIEEITTTNKWVSSYPEVFKGLGVFKETYSIKLQENATPYAISCPRRIPIPLKDKVKNELKKMEKDGIITSIREPTEWCAPLVVVPKKNGAIRMCVDYTQLNKYVERERLLLPSVEESLAQIGQAKYFSKLDTNSGFWQVKLETSTAKLTTFVTPFGRFFFNRLPFGLCSAPEHLKKKND